MSGGGKEGGREGGMMEKGLSAEDWIFFARLSAITQANAVSRDGG